MNIAAAKDWRLKVNSLRQSGATKIVKMRTRIKLSTPLRASNLHLMKLTLWTAISTSNNTLQFSYKKNDHYKAWTRLRDSIAWQCPTTCSKVSQNVHKTLQWWRIMAWAKKPKNGTFHERPEKITSFFDEEFKFCHKDGRKRSLMIDNILNRVLYSKEMFSVAKKTASV